MSSFSGVLFSMAAGLFIVLQSAFNSRSSEKIGALATVALVHGVGFIASLIVIAFAGGQGFNVKNFLSGNFLYYSGGIIGVMIVFNILNGIEKLGISYSMAIVLVIQLLASVIFDHFGLFGLAQNSVTIGKTVGIILMISGILLFRS